MAGLDKTLGRTKRLDKPPANEIPIAVAADVPGVGGNPNCLSHSVALRGTTSPTPPMDAATERPNLPISAGFWNTQSQTKPSPRAYRGRPGPDGGITFGLSWLGLSAGSPTPVSKEAGGKPFAPTRWVVRRPRPTWWCTCREQFQNFRATIPPKSDDRHGIPPSHGDDAHG